MSILQKNCFRVHHLQTHQHKRSRKLAPRDLISKISLVLVNPGIIQQLCEVREAKIALRHLDLDDPPNGLMGLDIDLGIDVDLPGHFNLKAIFDAKFIIVRAFAGYTPIVRAIASSIVQHFLLSSKAKTLGLVEVARLSEDEAYSKFREVRFAQNGGEPFCPHCGCLGVCEIKTRKIFKCKGCRKQFSLTSNTIFASRKMSMRDILLAIALFVDGANGVAALRLSRELKCSYKTAFVLEHKLREALGSLQATHKLKGIVEIDGMFTGGHVKKPNRVRDRPSKRKISPKRQSIVTMRERRAGGRTISFVCRNEAEAVPVILARVDRSARIRTDEGTSWTILPGYFADHKTVNHSKDGYSINGVHTNWVESFNGRVRRGIKGVYHRISGQHLQSYADEFAWREDHRRVANGTQFALLLKASARQPRSHAWPGYWQRRADTRRPANDNL